MGRRFYPHVEIHDNFVVKRYVRKSADIYLEYEKATMFFDACAKSGIIAPKVLDADFKQKTITYTRISDFQTLEDHYIKSMTGKADIEETFELQMLAGKGLAAIHQNMNLSNTSSWSASKIIEDEILKITNCSMESFLSETPQAIQHGDYGFANLGYKFEAGNTKPSLIIFDPSANNYFSNKPNEFCSIYIDLGLYFSDINGRVPVKFYPKMKWSNLPLIKASFIKGYQSESNIKLDAYKSEVMGYCAALSCYDKFYGDGMRKKLRMKFLYNRFKKNVFWK